MSTAAGTSTQTPVRLVLFDIFDTLCTPRLPIHEQYYEEAIKSGLPTSALTPESVRNAFKPAFKETNSTWPLYGKHSNPPLDPGQWWTELIKRCMINAGATKYDVEQSLSTLAPALLERFESDRGYRNFPETLDVLDRLKELGVKISIASNADPRILRTLDSLGILSRLTIPPTLSWDVETAKPDPRIFAAACEAAGVPPGEGVIMVGDELQADYHGSTSAGLEGRLIRREGEWSDGAVRTGGEDLDGVTVITSLTDIVSEVERRNTP